MSERWPRLRLGATYDVRDERAGAEAESLPLMSVSQIHGVVPRSILIGDQGRAEDLANYKICEPGDIVLNRMSAYNGALGVAKERGVVSPDYLVMTPRPTVRPEFIAAWLKTPAGVFEMTSRLRGIGSVDAAQVRTPRVNESDLKTISLAMPPLEEQRDIADYLDRETARIDTLIEEQQRLIEMLRERRQRVLARASDGDWPSASLGLLLDGIKDGTHGSFARTAAGEGMPLLGARNVMGSRVALDGAESYISNEDYEAIVANGFPARDDVLLVIVGATIGKTAVYDLAIRHAFQRSVAFLRPSGRLESTFLWYQIQASRFQDQLTLRAKTSAQPGIYMGDVTAIPVVVPALAEQREIVAFLDEQTAKIDALIAETERFIELSKERRSALITAAVTGLIDVRTVA